MTYSHLSYSTIDRAALNYGPTGLKEHPKTEMKRENRYKWEWGFMDKELKHQEEMLALTGVELFVIIVTAIVQMYCIKNLLDNRSIV